MEDSILKSVKNALDVGEDYTVYDGRIIMHINSVFSTLQQLGIGPIEGFQIEDDSALWSEFLLGDPRLNNVKTYVTLRTRMLFDPPTNAYWVTAMQDQIKELEWRMNVYVEHTGWTDPDPDPIIDDIIDGGYI